MSLPVRDWVALFIINIASAVLNLHLKSWELRDFSFNLQIILTFSPYFFFPKLFYISLSTLSSSRPLSFTVCICMHMCIREHWGLILRIYLTEMIESEHVKWLLCSLCAFQWYFYFNWVVKGGDIIMFILYSFPLLYGCKMYRKNASLLNGINRFSPLSLHSFRDLLCLVYCKVSFFWCLIYLYS